MIILSALACGSCKEEDFRVKAKTKDETYVIECTYCKKVFEVPEPGPYLIFSDDSEEPDITWIDKRKLD